MADRSKIEWTDASWNPVRARNLKTGKVGWHCEHATTGCAGCYAEGFNLRLGTGLPFKPGHLDAAEIELFLDETMLKQPLRWKKPRRIFVGSMTDLFGRFVPDEWLFEIFAVMGACEDQGLGHEFQVLTKRADRMRQWITAHGARAWNSCRLGPNAWPARNVWLGVSAERQQEADARIPELLATPAAVRFLSLEPLLGPIDLEQLAFPKTCECEQHFPTLNAFTASVFCAGCCEGPERLALGKLDQVIVGGESGKSARPMSVLWARELRDQCTSAGVAFFFKQWGEWRPAGCCPSGAPGRYAFGDYEYDRSAMIQVDSYPRQFTKFGARTVMQRIGKAAAGRLLDGVEHNAFPRVAPA